MPYPTIGSPGDSVDSARPRWRSSSAAAGFCCADWLTGRDAGDPARFEGDLQRSRDGDAHARGFNPKLRSHGSNARNTVLHLERAEREHRSLRSIDRGDGAARAGDEQEASARDAGDGCCRRPPSASDPVSTGSNPIRPATTVFASSSSPATKIAASTRSRAGVFPRDRFAALAGRCNLGGPPGCLP